MPDPRPAIFALLRAKTPELLGLPLEDMTRMPGAAEAIDALDAWITFRRVERVEQLLLAECDEPELQDLIATWTINTYEVRKAPLPDDVDELTASNYALWARAHGVADVLGTFLSSVMVKPVDTVTAYREYGGVTTIRDILQLGGTNRARAGYVLMALKHLKSAAEAREPALRAEAAREIVRAVPPEHPTLRGWWTLLRNERARLRVEAGPPAAVPDPFRWTWRENGDVLVMTEGVLGSRSSLSLRVLRWTVLPFLPQISHWPARDVLTVVDGVLDLLTDPGFAGHRASMAATLERPTWERDLAELDRVLAQAGQHTEGERLGWRIRGEDPSGWDIKPVWCKLTRTGTPSTRAVTDETEAELYAEEPGDRAVLAMTVRSRVRRVDDHALLDYLVGHPRLFTAGRTAVPIQLVRSEVILRIDRTATGDLAPVPTVDGKSVSDLVRNRRSTLDWSGAIAIWSSDTRIAVARMPRRLAEVVRALQARGPAMAADAADALLDRIAALEAIAPIELDASLRGEALPADLRPLLRMTGEPGSLHVALRVRPLPEHPALVPGAGATELHTVRDGVRGFVARDFAAESDIAADTAAALGLDDAGSAWSWTLAGPGQALDLLRRLRERPELAQVEWTGPPIRVGRRITGKDVRVTLGAARDWFQLQGGANIEGQRIDLDALLEAAREGQGWVRIKSGAWVDLEDTLHELLGAAAGLRQGAKAEVKLAPTHAPLVTALASAGAEVDAPPGWWSITERIEAARTLDTPVPADLNATLRSYQATGFQWLAALASWAPGAVLADDMGLGKTLQSIALLLHRRDGVSVVVAPTSVVDNWAAELAKFAPGLNGRVHRGAGRLDRLKTAVPGDVLLVSYDTLVRDLEAFGELAVHTLVIDEAHNIKNPGTNRAKALHALRADFVLALSGTPVENQLLDLWSLFRAASPGLLGGLEPFRKGLATAIQEHHDPTARAALARLVRPFILRRTKREVETELPARTEIVMPIDLSIEERALYERERLAAVVSMSGPTEGRQFQIFAALTRLRQLACHPRLVDPTSPIPSSKMARALELLLALREDGHQTLVFSQFTQHLKLLREALTQQGVRMRYLDGSTPAEQRGKEVAAFQAGDGEVFLISLKAGGTGLNLTAATYVIHLDPWWNPAAEDQATDRAHRIGQLRPVTVYRLVSRGTIEEQVVNLHNEKRELAAAVLEGTDTAHRASADELLALIATGGTIVEEE
jgi:superfamily II DNA or RNA helicase